VFDTARASGYARPVAERKPTPGIPIRPTRELA